MIKWEYKIETSFGNEGNLIRDLNWLGDMGWELVSITRNKSTLLGRGDYTSYLKRIKDQ